MSIKIIHHTDATANEGISPFDEVILMMAENASLNIACPYISISYLNEILKRSRSWRIISDLQAWLMSCHISQRVKTLEFIKTNQAQIRHVPQLHAKLIVSDCHALVGSANFTDNGILHNHEISVLFEKSSEVIQLQEWFETIWQRGLVVDLSKLVTHYETLPTKQEKSSDWDISITHTDLSINAHKALRPTLKSPRPRFDRTFHFDEIFPIIADIIQAKTSGNEHFLSHDELASLLQQDSRAHPLIVRAHEQRAINGQYQDSDKNIASNMIAHFSRVYTEGNSEWKDVLGRDRQNNRWAYRYRREQHLSDTGE